MTNLLGIHHITAITSSAPKIYDFYTNVLGLRLVKKTVNQDDINTYHLFFADDKGSPGTDITFFDFKGIPQARHGVNEISRSGFRVPSDEALNYWIKRFDKYDVKHTGIRTVFGRKAIYFNDFDGQPYALFSDEGIPGVKPGTPWLKGPVPNEFGIYGLGPVYFTVNRLESMKNILEGVFYIKEVKNEGSLHLFEMGEGGNGASVIVEESLLLPPGTQGYGGVHHVAFRVDTRQSLDAWANHLTKLGAPHSGYVDRYYFESVYTRLYPGILFELATDEPGFIDHEETYDILGEKLALPPAFINKRAYVESVVKHFDTVRSTKVFEKEYL